MAKKNLVDSIRYDPDYHPEHAAKYCLMGATNATLARLFEVAESTVEGWMQKHRAFKRAVLEGREIADAEVAHSLHRAAVGYTHPEEKIFCAFGEVTRVRTKKHYPPDTAAGKFILMNRQGWKDRSEQVVNGGDSPIVHEIRRVIVDPKPRTK